MRKAAGRGETWAGGQLLNPPQNISKKSAVSKAKDRALLAGLGGPVAEQAASLVSSVVATGSHKGRKMGSLLSTDQVLTRKSLKS